MDTYVLRIYRRDRQRPEQLVGVLHEVASEVERPFHGLNELCDMLRLPGTICCRKVDKKVSRCRRGQKRKPENP